MSWLVRVWRSWVTLLDRREPADALALLRMLTGIGVLHFIGSMIAAGVIELVYLGPADGGYLPIASDWWLVRLLGGPTPHTVWTLVIAAGVSGIAVTVGLGGRLAPLLCSQALIALHQLNAQQGSYAAITANALWLLVLSRSTTTLSLDCRLRSGRWTSNAPVPAWPRYVAIVQLAVIYTCTGLYKISAHWTPGGDMSALYYILQQPTWQRRDMSWVAWIYPLTQLATLVTWLFELSWPLVLVSRYYHYTAREPAGRVRRFFQRVDLRKPYVICGLVLHALIFATLEVGPFFVATLALYPCLFSPDELRSWVRRREVAEEPVAVGLE